MNKMLFTIFKDDNTSYKEFHGIKTDQDREMEISILFGLYANLCAYYIKGNYIDQAKVVI